MSDVDCLICQKHRGEGPLIGPVIYADEVVVAAHRAVGSLGYVFVESRRHVPYLDQLTDIEAAAVGRVVCRIAGALRAELDVDFVYTMVTGRAVPHFHQHVFVRHVGTPAEVPWWQEWSDAPHGDVSLLAERLRGQLTSRSPAPTQGRR